MNMIHVTDWAAGRETAESGSVVLTVYIHPVVPRSSGTPRP